MVEIVRESALKWSVYLRGSIYDNYLIISLCDYLIISHVNCI